MHKEVQVLMPRSTTIQYQEVRKLQDVHEKIKIIYMKVQNN
jgi:hypothetical protein